MELNNESVLNVLKSGDKSKTIDLLEHLTYKKFKELSNIYDDFVELVGRSVGNNGFHYLVCGFSNEDIWDLFDKFRSEIKQVDDVGFIQAVEYASYRCSDNTTTKIRDNFVIADVRRSKEESNKFLEYIFNEYEDRLSNITEYHVLLHFLVNMLDRGIDEKVLERYVFYNNTKLKEAFKLCDNNRLFDLFEGFGTKGQIFLLNHFYDEVYNHEGFKGLCNCLNDGVLVYLYKRNPSVISKIELRHFLRNRELNDETKEIIDKYDIEDLNNIFSNHMWGPVSNVRYVEKRFVDRMICDGVIETIGEDTPLFSNIYLKNLKEIRLLIEEKKITRNSEIYKSHFKVFYKYLVNNKHLGELDEIGVREIEKLFFRVLRKDGLWSIKELNSLSMIALFNRVGIIERWANQFSVEQILRFSVKEHKKLCELVKSNNKENARDCEQYVLKLMLLVGYQRAEYMLRIDSDIETLHHLVGGVSVRDIKIDNEGNPIVDNKFINLLFKDKDHNRVKLMLENKDSELYKYFPRIVNEWEAIKLSNKNKSLKEVIEFLKNGGVEVPSRYYRLKDSFKLIGRTNELILETFRLHDEMLERVESTIPRVKGNVNGYEYEVVRYDDMEGLTVGNATDCCFTVRGVSQTSLRHALTSKNGRILTVKKNGELLAHSWLWRNGNVLCLDNIEISKKINQVDFLEVYEEFASKIVEASIGCEGENQGITNVLIGGDLSESKYKGIGVYPCYVKGAFCGNPNVTYKENLPTPIEDGLYSDAKRCQWLIKGKGDFSFYQSDYYYMDERKEILEYDDNKKDDWELIGLINKKITALKIIKENKEDVSKIDVRSYKKVYCGEDFYVLVDKNGNVESFTCAYDDRSTKEMEIILSLVNKKR